jgi:hypothetical protein
MLKRPGACAVVEPTWRASCARWCLVARYERLRCVRAVRTALHPSWHAPTGQTHTTRPSPPEGAEGRCPSMPGITPAPGRRCAASPTREGVASAPPWGISRAIQGGSVSRDSMHRGEALAATRGGSAVRPHQAAGTARKHRQGRTVKGRGETGHSLVHRWAPSLS